MVATNIIARVQVGHNRIAVQGRDKNVEERVSEGVRLGRDLKLSLSRGNQELGNHDLQKQLSVRSQQLS